MAGFLILPGLLMNTARNLSRFIKNISEANSNKRIIRMTKGNYRYSIIADDSTIEKPLLDDRKYRYIKLEQNSLHVLLISDEQADKSAASLDVNVGSFADKEYKISGLAHFCEHLLFMGTEKYPEENEYSSYLSKHSGHSNAYTAPEHTNYYFEVGSDHLEGALDRFSQFFISPLFSKSCQDREIKAVDSENKKNLQSDLRRLHQLEKETSNKSHPFNGFSTGNYRTLHTDPTERGLNVREILIDFYKKHYSANIMSLVVLGKEDLDTLSSWSAEMFSAIKNNGFNRPYYGGEVIYKQENLNKLLRAEPVMDSHKIELSFMVPDDQETSWESKPSSYYSHLLGHESDGSILYFLKLKGWVNELSAGGYKACQGSSLFSLELDLTVEGLDNWKKVVVHIFQYLNLVLTDEPKYWIWKELSEMSAINFKFKQKQRAADTVSRISNSLYKFWDNLYIPPQYILSSSILRTFDAKKIKEYGSYLAPDNFRILLVSQNLDGLNLEEKWYGTKYSYSDLSEQFKDEIQNAGFNPNFHLPHPNEFIPSTFDITKQKSESPLKHPFLIKDTNKLQVWFKQDDQFEVPKAVVELLIHLPSSNESCRTALFSTLLADLIDDFLVEISYYANLVGLHFKINQWRDGLCINVSGYNDKLPVFLSDVLQKIISFDPSEERLEIMKVKLRQSLNNFFYEPPYYQVGTHLLTLVNEKTYTSQQKLDELDKGISFEEVKKFVHETIWKNGLFAEVLIQGNFNVNDASKIAEDIDHHFKAFVPIEREKQKIRPIISLLTHVIPSKTWLRYEVDLKDPNNVNSCIEYFIQVSTSPDELKLSVLTELLATVMRESCFNQLRTKEQLGYVVFSGLKVLRTSFGIRILVQSERSTSYLEFRIDEFLEKFGRYVNSELTDEGFAKFKQSLRVKKLAKLRNLQEEVNKFWNAISSGYFDFQESERHVEVLDTLAKEEFVKFYNDYVLNISGNSARLVLHLKSQNTPPLEHKRLLHASILNFCYRKELTVSSEIVDQMIEQYLSPEDLVPSIMPSIQSLSQESDNSSLEDELLAAIKGDLISITPEFYPKGELIESVETFKSSYPLSGPPEPISDLSTFYYPTHSDDHAHL